VEQSKTSNLLFFKKYFGEAPALWCMQLWEEHRFKFVVAKERKTKLGDFSMRGHQPVITVNGNLKPAAFLVTFLHELAHLLTYKDFQQRVAPHGKEWKANFSQLLNRALALGFFPQEVVPAIVAHINNPKAASCTDRALYKALNVEQDDGLVHISDLPDGAHFRFNGHIYVLIAKRSKWCTCEKLPARKVYNVSTIARVEPLTDEYIQSYMAAFANRGPTVGELIPGQKFVLDGLQMELIQHRRTKSLCRSLGTKVLYLVNQSAEITKKQ
jgi:hypothetical protein